MDSLRDYNSFIHDITGKLYTNFTTNINLNTANINLNTKMNSVRKLMVKQKQDIIVKTP